MSKRRVDIKGYPIFETGKWNKLEFSEADLDAIAATFNELYAAKVHNVPLKFGHNDEQPLTDGQPALGWVESVRRVGKQLLADFVDVPKIVVEMMRKRRFRAVSIELLMGLKRGDKEYKYVLDAVAILGADAPAVNTLPDLSLYLAKRSLGNEGGQRLVFERQAREVKFSVIQRNNGGSTVDEETQKLIDAAVLAATTPLRAEIKTLETQLTEFKRKFSEEEDKAIKLTTEVKNLRAQEQERADTAKRETVKLARKAIVDVLEKAVKDGQLEPARRDQAIKMFKVEDDAEVVKLDVQGIKDFLGIKEESKDKNKSKKKFDRSSEESQSHGTSEEDDRPERKFKDPGAEINHRARLIMSRDGKKSYKDATREVFAEDPELHREYVGTEPPMRASAGGEA